MLIAAEHFTWFHVGYIIFLFCFAEDEEGMYRVAGSSIFTFQKAKRGHSMAQTGESLRPLLLYGVSYILLLSLYSILHTFLWCFYFFTNSK